MKRFFKELFEYDHHFNQALISVISAHSEASAKSLRLFSHMLNAHHIWNGRILKNNHPLYSIWEVHSVEHLEEISLKNYHDSLRILDEFEPDEIVQFKTFKGDEFSNTVRDILFHIINHSTYHRGQIAAEFRQSGIEPVPTDYILYKMRTAKG